MKTERCHFIGIGGIGMSALAKLMLQKNLKVSGSDRSSSPMTEVLGRAGAEIFQGHSKDNIDPEMTVIYSSAISDENPEMKAAKEMGCSLIHRSDLLHSISSEYKTLAVAGTHGKTSTSALLAHTLKKGALDPSYAIGGVVLDGFSHAAIGAGEYFVLEADESDGSFKNYTPHGGIVTNIDNDHLDHYGSIESLQESFRTFVGSVENKNIFFWNRDDPLLRELNLPGLSYGTSSGCDLTIESWEQRGWSLYMNFLFEGRLYSEVELQGIGEHNVYNGAAVFGLALLLQLPEKAIREAFQTFSGVSRRVEKKGEVSSVLVLDDYAHHPTEIETTLKGVRAAEPEKRIVAVFQPHRFSRTRDCLGLFGSVFDAVDEVIITDLYSAGERPITGVSHEPIMHELAGCSKADFRYLERDQLAEHLLEKVRPHDIVITLGAGDITALSKDLVEGLLHFPPRKWRIGLICGGRSPEHEVSIDSARTVFGSFSREIYDLKLFKIAKSGEWIFGEPSLSEERSKEEISGEVIRELMECDLFFPMLHGPYGEDGTIQGLFEMLGKGYSGSNHLSSALTMDKNFTKRICESYGFKTAKFLSFHRFEWEKSSRRVVERVLSSLKFPLFIKPVHLGSSVGVQKVIEEDAQDLEHAIQAVFEIDSDALVEEAIIGKELEFAVIGNVEVKVSSPAEVLSGGLIYDYESKYSSSGIASTTDVELPQEVVERGKAFAAGVYRALRCQGMARIDCFLDGEGEFILNEVNSIPGFTPHSLFPKMWEREGISLSKLLDHLVVYALHKSRV